MEYLSFILMVGASNLGEPAFRCAGEAASRQLSLDKMAVEFVDKKVTEQQKQAILVLYSVNEIVGHQRISVKWEF